MENKKRVEYDKNRFRKKSRYRLLQGVRFHPLVVDSEILDWRLSNVRTEHGKCSDNEVCMFTAKQCTSVIRRLRENEFPVNKDKGPTTDCST